MGSLLWLIAIVLVVLWLLGAFVVNVGGLINLLLIVVVVLVIINLIRMMSGRRRAQPTCE